MMNYSINDLEKITGIKAHTIRMWEKRYDAIQPGRTSTNIRYYKDCDLKRLLNISTLNKHGIKISHIIKMCQEEVNEKILEISNSVTDFESYINSLVIAMIELNEDSFEKILSNTLIKIGFEKAVTHVLYPFLEKVGVLWLVGTINPAQEHFIVNLIRQKLIVAIDGQEKVEHENAKTFLLFLPENELHELGLLFYTYLIKKQGHKVIYLGQSVPYDDLIEVLKIRNAHYLFTYFVAGLATEDIPTYLSKLSADLPDKKIFISGLQVNKNKLKLSNNIIPIQNADAFREILNTL
jgi:MerR family transcriptional regulator, light-induced transcriptional regulator